MAMNGFAQGGGVPRKGKDTMTQTMKKIISPVFVTAEGLAEVGELSALFAVRRPLALEIGCGIGDFIVQRAAQQPQVNFLAIDIYNQGCLKTCRRVDAAGLDNVLVARVEARFLLTNYGRPESLAAVYINCPDPWPKKRHHRRRLLGGDFLSLLYACLQPAGELYFSTDFAHYAEAVADLLAGLPEWENCLEAPWASTLPDYPASKYQLRFLEQGLPVFYFHRRKAVAAASHMPLLEASGQ
jgi:tRNA (guanine-N7-)-methyltransferase